jgi:glycosyltransferase involved in cell wall biosynthesis
MRIAVWHNLPSGGGKRALYDQVSGLVERGHAVEVWCPPTADVDFLPLSRLAPEHIVPLDRPRTRRRHRLLPELLRDVHLDIEAMDHHCRQCVSQMRGRGFDVLFAGCCQFFRVTSIARYSPLPSLIYLGEPNRWLYEALPESPWAASTRPAGWWHSPTAVRDIVDNATYVRQLRVQVREEIANARSFDSILVNSRFSRESVLRAYGISARVAYLGVDLSHFPDLELPRESFLLTVGAAVPEKNVSFIVRALARRAGERVPLVWVANVASPEEIRSVRNVAAALGIELDIRVNVPHDELVRLMNTAACLVYAPRLEPFGLVPLEAAACRLPVVAVAEGGVRESVVAGVTGFLVDDEGEFAAAVDRILADPALSYSLRQGAREFVEGKWSAGQALDRLEENVERVVRLKAEANDDGGHLYRSELGSRG